VTSNGKGKSVGKKAFIRSGGGTQTLIPSPESRSQTNTPFESESCRSEKNRNTKWCYARATPVPFQYYSRRGIVGYFTYIHTSAVQ
jgi:hypothetical protein